MSVRHENDDPSSSRNISQISILGWRGLIRGPKRAVNRASTYAHVFQTV